MSTRDKGPENPFIRYYINKKPSTDISWCWIFEWFKMRESEWVASDHSNSSEFFDCPLRVLNPYTFLILSYFYSIQIDPWNTIFVETQMMTRKDHGVITVAIMLMTCLLMATVMLKIVMKELGPFFFKENVLFLASPFHKIKIHLILQKYLQELKLWVSSNLVWSTFYSS